MFGWPKARYGPRNIPSMNECSFNMWERGGEGGRERGRERERERERERRERERERPVNTHAQPQTHALICSVNYAKPPNSTLSLSL